MENNELNNQEQVMNNEPVVPETPVPETPVEAAPAPAPAPATEPVPEPAPAPAEPVAEPTPVAPVVPTPTSEPPKKQGKAGIIVLVLILLAAIGVGCFFLGQSLTNNKDKNSGTEEKQEEKKEENKKEETNKEEQKEETENKEEKKEEEKQEEAKPASKDGVIYTSSYKDLKDLDKYKTIVKDKAKNLVKRSDITGDSDTIAIKSFQFIAYHYSFSTTSGNTSGGDLRSDKCSVIGSQTFDKNNMNKDAVCLSDATVESLYLPTEYGDEVYIIDDSNYKKLKEYYPSSKLESIKNYCAKNEFTVKQCNENHNVAFSGMATGDNDLMADVETVTKTNNKYVAVISFYRSTEEDADGVTKVEKVNTYKITASVNNGHIILEKAE